MTTKKPKKPKVPQKKPRVCYVLIGLPGAGKSTFRDDLKKQYFLEHHGDPKRALAVLSTDDIIEIIAKTQGKTYSEVWKDNIGKAEEIMWERLDTATGKNYMKLIKFSPEDIVIDRTNLTVKSRAKFLGRLPKKTYALVAVYFPTPPEDLWKVRLEGRPGKVIPEKDLQRMADSLELPSEDEGFDEIITVKGW